MKTAQFVLMMTAVALSADALAAEAGGLLAEMSKAEEIPAIHYAPPRMNLLEPDLPGPTNMGRNLVPMGGIIPYLAGIAIFGAVDSSREQAREKQNQRREETLALAGKLMQQDPVLHVKARMLEDLGAAGLGNVRLIEQALDYSDDGSLKKFSAAFVVDFRTSFWGLSRMDEAQWEVFYGATARIVRPHNGEVLARMRCVDQSLKGGTLEQLVGNQGERLQSLFREMALACAKEILADRAMPRP